METSPERKPEKPRIEWMDALRGIAIMLVVFEHSTRFVHQELGSSFIPVLDPISDTLNPIRMPAMAFLSGLLLAPSLAKGAAPYLWGKVRNVAWPFVVWSFLYISAWIVAAPISGTPHSYAEMGAILWDPPGHLWYLRDLFVFYLVSLAIHALPASRSPGGRTLAMLGAAALSVTACALTRTEDGQGQFERIFFLGAFFLLGGWFSAQPRKVEALLSDPRVAIAAVATALLLIPVAMTLGNVRYDWRSVPLTLAGIVSMALVTRSLCRTAASPALRFMGRTSLTIYVFHWIVVAGTAIVVAKLVPDIPPAAMTLLVFGVGMAASLAMVFLARRVPALDILFSFPRSPRRAASPGQPTAPRAHAVPKR